MKKQFLKFMILSALSGFSFLLHGSAYAASSADIPLQWYTFEVSTEIEEVEEAPEEAEKTEEKEQPSRIQSDSQKSGRTEPELQQKENKPQKTVVAEEKAENKAVLDALATQNQQLEELMKTIQAQQEQIRLQQSQLAELQKYKETMVISSKPATIDETELSPQPSDALLLEYMPGSTYQIYCRPGFETDVQLQHDEEIVNVIAGDPARWSIRTVNGAIMPHIYIKPIQLGIETNLIVTTNKRSYQISLRAEREFNPIVNWTYPLNGRNEYEKKDVPVEVESVNQLSFAYRISKKYKWKPDFVFNDGFRTYIHMPANALEKSPAIFIRNPDGMFTLVNYTVKNGNYILDRVVDDAELRIDNQIVQIRREGR